MVCYLARAPAAEGVAALAAQPGDFGFQFLEAGVEGGDGGGLVVVEGTPEQVAKTEDSYTGQFLAPLLGL